ncbi:MAG: aminomethyl-transferring glycine dehydrogenase subunit GcvPB [Eubacteriales bacterium]|nr:aminomethyl-transferring glycine dehydrogenase subunit GcvPB [Eubacteriales bacterium]
MELIFEISKKGRRALEIPKPDVPGRSYRDNTEDATVNPLSGSIPSKYLRNTGLMLPEVSEPDLVRHYTALSDSNHGVDSGFYPLGSCTMKYNPKINEDMAALEGFTGVHPLQPEETVQGCLELMYKLEKSLSAITGMSRFTLQPAAGAHGEMTGLMIIKAYHDKTHPRRKIIVPDSAHGTNPASAAAAGFETVELKSSEDGGIDPDALRALMDENIAGLMLTNPNTLGLFEKNIREIADIVHDAGGLLYYDGANANAIMGISRPGDMGFDVLHLNLHKTFSTPHGGGGPGSGPVGVAARLEPFLPVPAVKYENGRYSFDYDLPDSIGKVRSFYGNYGVAVKAYTYIIRLGFEGLKQASVNAVLNARYLMQKLAGVYELPYKRSCMHEFVLSCTFMKKYGVSAMDVAKRLIDFGFHPPTVYFPLIVKEALMIEPTETESKETLDRFINAMLTIAEEAEKDPELLKNAPHTTPVTRPDDVAAARKPVLRYI